MAQIIDGVMRREMDIWEKQTMVKVLLDIEALKFRVHLKKATPVDIQLLEEKNQFLFDYCMSLESQYVVEFMPEDTDFFYLKEYIVSLQNRLEEKMADDLKKDVYCQLPVTEYKRCIRGIEARMNVIEKKLKYAQSDSKKDVRIGYSPLIESLRASRRDLLIQLFKFENLVFL